MGDVLGAMTVATSDDAPFRVARPALRSTSLVFASPHSGRCYPADLLARSQLDRHAIRSSEDAFVDELFAAAPGAGAPLLMALAPRAWIDLNRDRDELDPALVDGARRAGHNPRIASGLGVVPRVVAGGRAIYAGRIGLDEARARIRDVWLPYHAALARLMDEAHRTFGQAILIDCHSMPHEAIEAYAGSGKRPEVVLGDRFGAAADAEIVERVEAAFATAGLRVSRNAPFAGAYVAQHYGCPAAARHVVQIEIDRALYMDEAAVRPSRDFDAFRTLIAGIVADIAGIGRVTTRIAAE